MYTAATTGFCGEGFSDAESSEPSDIIHLLRKHHQTSDEIGTNQAVICSITRLNSFDRKECI